MAGSLEVVLTIAFSTVYSNKCFRGTIFFTNLIVHLNTNLCINGKYDYLENFLSHTLDNKNVQIPVK